MNATTRPDDELIWPPPDEDLDAIEVLDLHAAAAAATATASPSGPGDAAVAAVAPAAVVALPADAPQGGGTAGGVTEILQLDAVSGQESYPVDIHPFPRAPAPEPTPVAALARQDAEELLEWPPREADLDAIDVVPLGEPPGTPDAAAPDSGGEAVSRVTPATVEPSGPFESVPAPDTDDVLVTDGGRAPGVSAPAAEPSAPVRTALDAWEGDGTASAPSARAARALAVLVVALLAVVVWFVLGR